MPGATTGKVSSYQFCDQNGANCFSPAAIGSGNMGGAGTANYHAKFTATNTLGSSLIYDNGSGVAIGTTNPGTSLLNVQQTGANIAITGQTVSGIGVYGGATTSGVGVQGASSSAQGIYGSSTSGIGVQGQSTSAQGLYGSSSTSYGIQGYASSNIGIVGQSGGAYA